ncbi:hypothetical protein P875_00075909 [Aspergillus parasiticus SU-1]|uniref:Uncharacterized protein n=3 Tax=Aspergillus subgen. Circumdati TaxID=2720871 RepID=A0A5N6D4B3_ASPPA|nr:hypothetical protein BDV34DRAFT_22804 [Aspergillus parasiticus]KAE8307008.1 hypothetical protein BDV41DRAFT_582758 [Aspergillus transmontanensis]KJK68565.1 hypothetical protein P875_00075909 [Aspergillus parasiticus SU-1]
MPIFSKAQETVQKAMSSATGSNRPDLSKWNTEEMLETTVDEHGNPVPDASYTDGDKLSRGILGQDEADAYVAATGTFHHSTKDDALKPDFSKWNTEEMLETTLDKHGNPVPNASYTDYDKLSRGRLGDDDADAYIAANKNFHKPKSEFVDYD